MLRLLVAFTVTVLASAIVTGQVDRREQIKTPGLVIDVGAPTGAVRGLAFTSDGKHLLAAGEDKVVRQWPVTADRKIDRAGLTTFRWRTWHEWRGAIYVMALSPDPAQKYVAIGGYAAVLGEVVIIERATGKVVAAMGEPKGFDDLRAITTGLAFDRDVNRLAIGTGLGGLFVWEFTKGKDALTRVGTHKPRDGIQENFVHRILFKDREALVSVAQDGAMLRWPPAEAGVPIELSRTTVPNADVSAYCQAAGLLALGGRDNPSANIVEIRRLDGNQILTLDLPKGSLARALAISTDGASLAVGVHMVARDGRPYSPQPAEVWLCEVKGGAIRRRAVVPIGFYPQALAFHPDGKTLAVAGGDDFGIRLIDVVKAEVEFTVRSPGFPLWGVGLDNAGKKLGFRTERTERPTSYNERGTGEWRVFDLNAREFSKQPAGFAPVVPAETMGGWAVDTSGEVWVAVKGVVRFPLPIVREQDIHPTCYTFVKGPGGGVELAIGHKWGFSLFALSETGARRVAVGYGHGSEVTAIAPSADGKQIVSAGRDQTICGWSLAAWAGHRELGAAFEVDGVKLVVSTVADGGAAWEAGLALGDDVVGLAVADVDIPQAGWAAALAQPEPNKELYFTIHRRGVADFNLLTTVRRRPLWKFLPLEKDEWALWRWRDYYYDSSANGDAAVGWQVNGSLGETPTFLKAEQLRRSRRKPDKVREVFETEFVPEKAAIYELLPPRVDLTVAGDPVAGGLLSATVTLRPVDDAPARRPQSVGLWVNDYKVASWAVDELGPASTVKTVTIPTALLRAGDQNRVTAMAYDGRPDAARGESNAVTISGPPVRGKPRLHGLFVGVADYSGCATGPMGQVVPNLIFPVRDAEEMKRAWAAQAGDTKLWAEGKLIVLTGQQFDRPKAVLDAIKSIAADVAADDLVIVYMSGHGWAKPAAEVSRYGRGSFAFVGPRFDLRRYQDTGLTSEDLYDALTAVPARKLLLIDACYSGGASADAVRAMTPEGHGPPILAAAQASEQAFEFPGLGHGLFTRVLLDALTDDFSTADRNADGRIDPEELGDYTARRVPEVFARIKPFLPAKDQAKFQTPLVYPRAYQLTPDARIPIARAQGKQ